VLDLETMTTLRQTEALCEGRIDVGLFRLGVEAVVYRGLSDDLTPWQMSVAWSPDNRSRLLARFLDLVAGPGTA
jgi:hypothetical protein